MSDDIDIVDRLRINWTSLTDKQNAERNEAADEIERLRRNTGCARNQRSTQFCAEAVDAQREVERIRADREKCHDIMESQSHQLARMARDIEMFREMVAEMRERNNKLLHKLQEFEAREAE